MHMLEVQRDSHDIKILTTSESDKVILAVHWIIVAARFDPGLIRNTTPIVSKPGGQIQSSTFLLAWGL